MNPESPKLESRSYEPFDPGIELKNIRKYDKETRPERLESYKQELIKQKEGIAEIQNDLEKQIRENPDLSHEELMKTVFNKAPEYRLSENQLDLFKKTLSGYVEKHQAIRETRKKYPDDKELFKTCFGKEPGGIVEITERPMTLYFRCHDLKDYAWIYNLKFLDKKKKTKLTKSDIRRADTTAGAHIGTCLAERLNPVLENTITIEKARGESMASPRAKDALIHEEQHAIYRLFKKLELKKFIEFIDKTFAELFAQKIVQDEIVKEFQDKKNPKLLVDYLKSIRSGFENRAKDEILAFYKGEYHRPHEIKEMLLRSSAEGGLYDHLANYKDYLEENLRKQLTPKIFRRNKKTIKNIFRQVFVDEYKKEIIEAVNTAEELKNIGKSKNEIVHLLTTEPLSRWQKIVKRIKEVKK